MNLRQLQIQCIERMMKFSMNQKDSTNDYTSSSSLAAPSSSDADSHEWKVLIYDDIGQKIISPLLTTKQLNALGVTLFLHINSLRDQIEDVPAVYFIKPTQPIIEKLSSDISRSHLYASYHIHCISPIRRTELELLAQNTISDSSLIHRLYDEYLDYICLDNYLVTLSHRHSYIELNNNHATEEQIFTYIDRIVDQLFCIIVTIGQIPIIRCRPGEAAEQVAIRLDRKLREHLLSKNNLFTHNPSLSSSTTSSTMTTHRPLLILLDRNIDLNTPLSHSWSYESLLNDLLGYQNNKVTVVDTDASSTSAATAPLKPTTKRTYDLNTNDDNFYRKFHHTVFHEVSQQIVERQQKYQADVKAIQQRTGHSIDPNNPQAALYDSTSGSVTSGLSDALTVLPKMQRTKRIIDTHMNLATALLKQIQEREIDLYYREELTFMSDKYANKNELMKLLTTESKQSKGSYTDQLRAFLIYYLSNVNANESLIHEILPLLQSLAQQQQTSVDSHTDRGNGTVSGMGLLKAIDYIKEFKFIHKLGSDVSAGINTRQSNDTSSSNPAAANKPKSMFDSLAANVIGQATDWLQGVKSLLPTNNDLPVTRIVDLLMNNRETVDTQSYLYFDPKIVKAKGAITQSSLMSSTVFHDSLVCILGGGSYNEYQNLQSYISTGAGERGVNSITYIATEMTSPNEFLQQLATLGRGKGKDHDDVPVD